MKKKSYYSCFSEAAEKLVNSTRKDYQPAQNTLTGQLMLCTCMECGMEWNVPASEPEQPCPSCGAGIKKIDGGA